MYHIIAMNEKQENSRSKREYTPYARRVSAVSDAKKRDPMAFVGKLRAFSFEHMALLFSPSACNYCR